MADEDEKQVFEKINSLPEEKKEELRVLAVGILLEGFFALGDWVSQGLEGELGERTAEMVIIKNIQALNVLGVTKDEINEANSRIEDSPLEKVYYG